MANKILSSVVLYIVFSGIILFYYIPRVIEVIYVEINYKVPSIIIATSAIVHAFNSIKSSRDGKHFRWMKKSQGFLGSEC
jgi:hypothetical protein